VSLKGAEGIARMATGQIIDDLRPLLHESRACPVPAPPRPAHSVCSTEQGAGEYHPPAPSCSDYRVGMLVLGPLQVDVHVQHISDETLANRLWCLLPGGLQLNCIHPELLQRGE
jgi:hypothetical protein